MEHRESTGLMENGHRPSRDGRRQGGDSPQVSVEDSAGRRKEALRQLTLPQCLLSFEYWVLWLAMYIGIGSGFTFLNNLGNILQEDQPRLMADFV